MFRFLWIGQGQRYLSKDDIESFKEAAIKMNSDNPENRTLFLRSWNQSSDHLPEDDLSIIKLAILFTIHTKTYFEENIFPYGNIEFIGHKRFAYFLNKDPPYDIWTMLTEVSLTNYPLLLSMIEQKFGFVTDLYPPNLRVTAKMVDLMKRSKSLNSDQIEIVLRQLEDGKHTVTKVSQDNIQKSPRYAHISQETWADIEWSEILLCHEFLKL